VTTVAFDSIAPAYRHLWSHTAAGRTQREAVWRHMTPMFAAGSHVLDIGCGTGDDAIEMEKRGLRITAIDASTEMVRIARERGANARVCRAEEAGNLRQAFDGIFSNFGALNCVEDLHSLRAPLAQKVRAGGWLAICLLGRICAWETVWYLLRGDAARATRRWSGEASSSVASRVFYPTISNVRRALAPEFTLTTWHGIGLFVPPSFVQGMRDAHIRQLAKLDKLSASLPLARAVADHRLLLFRKAEPC
jgi:trans-aconitate methyltransferase